MDRRRALAFGEGASAVDVEGAAIAGDDGEVEHGDAAALEDGTGLANFRVGSSCFAHVRALRWPFFAISVVAVGEDGVALGDGPVADVRARNSSSRLGCPGMAEAVWLHQKA